jgi:hypothetical protein
MQSGHDTRGLFESPSTHLFFFSYSLTSLGSYPLSASHVLLSCFCPWTVWANMSAFCRPSSFTPVFGREEILSVRGIWWPLSALIEFSTCCHFPPPSKHNSLSAWFAAPVPSILEFACGDFFEPGNLYFRSAIQIHRRSWRFWCLLEGDRLLINVSRRSFNFQLFPLCVHMNILVSKATLAALIPPIIAPPPLTCYPP